MRLGYSCRLSGLFNFPWQIPRPVQLQRFDSAHRSCLPLLLLWWLVLLTRRRTQGTQGPSVITPLGPGCATVKTTAGLRIVETSKKRRVNLYTMGLLWQCWNDGLDILIDCPCKFESKWLEKLDISGETKTQRAPPNNNFP